MSERWRHTQAGPARAAAATLARLDNAAREATLEVMRADMLHRRSVNG